MDTIESKWNEVFIQFMDQLNILFPSSPAKSIKMQFYMSKMIQKQKPIDLFLDHLLEHENEIIQMDNTHFFGPESNIPFIEQLKLKEYFLKASKDNKIIIWQYLQTLFGIAKEFLKLK